MQVFLSYLACLSAGILEALPKASHCPSTTSKLETGTRVLCLGREANHRVQSQVSAQTEEHSLGGRGGACRASCE